MSTLLVDMPSGDDQILEVEFENDIDLDTIKACLRDNSIEYITYNNNILLIGHCYDELLILK